MIGSFDDLEETFSNASLACKEFSLHHHKALLTLLNDNVVSSPLSIHIILSLLSHGAQGTTLKEMKEALHLDRFSPTPEEFRSLRSKFNAVQRIELSIENALYIHQGFELLPEFMQLSKDAYHCMVSRVDYTQAVQAAKEINEWVEKQTKNKIKDIVRPDEIKPLTRLVLINTIYFKGRWMDPFEKVLTRDKKFYLTTRNSKSVPTMYNKSRYSHGDLEDWNAKFLEIPYENRDFVLIIILPNEIEGLGSLEEKFSWDVLAKAQTSSREIKLFMPKFKIEFKIDLEESFHKLGMKAMFTGDADFSTLAECPLFVDKAVHKVFIEVDEEGTEAAAATAVFPMAGCSLIMSPPEEFHVDHPFMFAIQHKPSGVPLFFGSVRNIPT